MKTVAKILFGSKLYGTDTPASDTDYKEIFVPDSKSLVIGNAKNHMSNNTGNDGMKNTSEDIDHELFSLKYFIGLAMEGETVALDIIHAPAAKVVHTDLPHVWAELQANRSKFYTTDMKSYLGYVRKQAAKYGVKGSRMAALRQVVEVLDTVKHEKWGGDAANELNVKITTDLYGKKIRVKDLKDRFPVNEFCEWVIDENQKAGAQEFYVVLGRKFQLTISIDEMKRSIYKLWEDYGERARQAEQNNGIDWKALSHALRGGYQLEEIYKTGDLVYPLSKAEHIKDVKAGLIDFKSVQEELEDVVSSVEILSEQARKNGMREKADPDFWNEFIERVYLESIMSDYNLMPKVR